MKCDYLHANLAIEKSCVNIYVKFYDNKMFGHV